MKKPTEVGFNKPRSTEDRGKLLVQLSINEEKKEGKKGHFM